MAQKKNIGGGIASLVRQAGQQAKLTIRHNEEEKNAENELLQSMLVEVPEGAAAASVYRPPQPRIFSVIEYIESSWGLGMKLFPVQRFIVKLYYHIPLEDRLKTITVSDMFNSKVLYNFTEVEYLRYLHNEGRCNIGVQDHERRLLILPIGRRAGKCCAHGTICLTSEGFREIQDLGNPNGPEYQPLQIGVPQEGSKRSTSAFFYNGGDRDTLRIRSWCGYEIEGTPNHRIRVMAEDGTIQWRFLGDMRVGDRIGVHRKTELWPSSVYETSKFHPAKSGKEVRLPDVFDERWATLLGVLVGDGSWNNRSLLEVTVGPYPEWLTQVRDLFRTTLGRVRVLQEPKRDRVFRLRCHSVRARLFFDCIGYTLNVANDAKCIPWIIWRSPRPVVAAFLRGLFETDGGVERGGRIVSFSTASQKLARELQLLLLNFGIVSRVKSRLNKRYAKTYYHLTVLGADSIRVFAREIGFLSERKTKPLHAHLVKGDLGNKSATEAIPFQHAWCRKLLDSVPKNNGDHARGEALGWRKSLLRAALGNVIKSTTEDLSYPRIRAALAVAREVGASQEAIVHFEAILEAGYFYDEVTEVTPSRARVYDLTVPDGESFVANGFVNHNTTMSSIFASYEVYRLLNLNNPQGYYGLPNGNRIQILSVATDKDQAGILFNEVTTHLARCEYFKPYIANNTLSHIQFRTPYDIERYGDSFRHSKDGKFTSLNGKATLRVTFKSCVAKGLRGSGNVVIILDEMAHFQDKGNSSAKEIYDAVTPSAAAFSPKHPETGLPAGPVESRIICISSPLNRSGKFFELYDQAMHGGPGAENMLAIQGPTWEVNPTLPASYYRQKYHEDPAVFMTEHGAQFSDRVRVWIEREADLMACVDPEHRPSFRGAPREPHQMGVDVALVNDGSSVSITKVEGDQIVLVYHEVWYAGVDWREANPHLGEAYPTPYARHLKDVERLDFEEIANWIEALSKRFYITDGVFDRWSGLPLEQGLSKRGLKQFRSDFFTRDQTSRMYQATKLLMFDQKLRLYDWPKVDEQLKHSPFINELLKLQAEQVSKNVILVHKSESVGAKDDQSDAYSRAVWLSYQRLEKYKHIGGTHTSGGPVFARGSSVASYQLARARKHGGFTERTVFRNMGFRGRGR
jgi:intein/homing endonuclease